MILFENFFEWRKNPTCSAECCLTLAQPMVEFSGTVTNMAGTTVRKHQLVSMAEGPQTLRAAVGEHLQFGLAEEDAEDVPPESGATANANDMADEKDPDEQETKS